MDEAVRPHPATPGVPHRVATVPQRVVASWRRSADYGVSPDTVDPVFTGDVDDTSVLVVSGRRVLGDIGETLADEPVSLVLTDARGLVLTRTSGDHALLRALDEVRLAPGFDYSEPETGTTGLGLALADREPALVRAEQHYCRGLWGYTGAAAPLRDPVTGDLLGSVDLTTWSERSHALLLTLATSAARHIEARMLARFRGRPPRAPGRRVGRGPPATRTGSPRNAAVGSSFLSPRTENHP